jgi:FkbM family methyltransferase
LSQLLDTPKYGDLIYDIGLHKGEDTDFYLRKGFRVVAIEADPDLVAHCEQRFSEFLERGRLTIVPGAIVDPKLAFTARKVTFFKNDEVSVWGTVSADWAARNDRRGSPSRAIDVDAIDLVDVIATHGVPRYMKVDIEGADIHCIEALGRLCHRPDYVSIESDRSGFGGIVGEIDLLASLGYDAFQAVEQARIPRLQRPPKPAREGAFVEWTFEPGSSGLFGAELPGRWKSRDEVLRQYRLIAAGYYLFDKDGMTRSWTFPGARHLRTAARRAASALLGVPMASWYDTHARHRSVSAEPHPQQSYQRARP